MLQAGECARATNIQCGSHGAPPTAAAAGCLSGAREYSCDPVYRAVVADFAFSTTAVQSRPGVSPAW